MRCVGSLQIGSNQEITLSRSSPGLVGQVNVQRSNLQRSQICVDHTSAHLFIMQKSIHQHDKFTFEAHRRPEIDIQPHYG